ncbi:MAG: hypothetical protein ACRDRZ_08815 [Pseudonocardiaceae bacterium]
MTDEDRDLMKALARLNQACAGLGLRAGVIEDELSQEDQVELALQFIDMAERVLRRALPPVKAVDARPYVNLPYAEGNGS